jgi:hypothetical protein
MINQLHKLSDEIIPIRILQYKPKGLKTQDNLGKYRMGRALLKSDLYVISDTDIGIVSTAEMDAILASLKEKGQIGV